ncbi:hypothetical protein LEMLEM_LOCUS20628 [Lemmus lemmus]
MSSTPRWRPSAVPLAPWKEPHHAQQPLLLAGPPWLEEIKTSPESRLCGRLDGSDHTLSPLLLNSAYRETPTPLANSREFLLECFPGLPSVMDCNLEA